jgi:thiamine biosynthesis lipoprotein
MRRSLAVILCLPLLLLAGCRRPPAPEKKSVVGFYFDTVITLSAYTDDDSVLTEALDRCAAYEKLFSRTIEGSDIWRVNREGGAVEVSPETIRMLQAGMEVSEASAGAFDPTIEPVSSLWDFSGETAILPDAQALREAAGRVDYRKLAIEDGRLVLPLDMGLDPGGIAKGYIADRIGELLRAGGVKSALINLGGNVLTIGRRAADDERWVVGIQDPRGETGANKLTLRAEDMSVVTSGNYERYFILDGVRYHHLLDPQTGWPVDNGLDSVTILSRSSVLGDALSTACYVRGLEEGMELVAGFDGVEAIFIGSDGTITMTEGAKALVVEAS